MREAKVFDAYKTEVHRCTHEILTHRPEQTGVLTQVRLIDSVKFVNCLYSMVFPPKIVQITQDFKTVKINDSR